MSSQLKDGLPAVDLPGRWNHEVDPAASTVNDEGTIATSYNVIDASSAEEAEKRVLARVLYDYEDDLRDATATATGEVSPGRWAVRLDNPGEY